MRIVVTHRSLSEEEERIMSQAQSRYQGQWPGLDTVRVRGGLRLRGLRQGFTHVRACPQDFGSRSGYHPMPRRACPMTAWSATNAEPSNSTSRRLSSGIETSSMPLCRKNRRRRARRLN